MAHQTKRRRPSAEDEARDREVIARALAKRRRAPQPRAASDPRQDEVRRLDGGPATEFNPTWRGDERGEVM